MHKNNFILEPKNGPLWLLILGPACIMKTQCVPDSKVIFNTRLGNIAFVAWINSVWNLVSRLKEYLFYLGYFCHVSRNCLIFQWHLIFLPKVGRKLTQTVTFEQNSIIDLQSDGLLNKFLISWVGCIKDVWDFSLSCFHTWLIPPPVSRPTIQLSKLSWKCNEECFIILIQYQPLYQT